MQLKHPENQGRAQWTRSKNAAIWTFLGFKHKTLYLNDETGTGRGIDRGNEKTPENQKLQTNLRTVAVLMWEVHYSKSEK